MKVGSLTVAGVALVLLGLYAASSWFMNGTSSYYSSFLQPPISQAAIGVFLLAAISFLLAGRRLTRGQGVVAAVTLLAFGIGFVLIGSFTTGLVGSLGPLPFAASGSINAAPVSGDGTVTIQVRDTSGLSITSITLSNSGLPNASTIPTIGNLVLLYQGRSVSSGNPLPAGATASGTLQASDLIANLMTGAMYSMDVNAIFSNGSHLEQTLSVTALA